MVTSPVELDEGHDSGPVLAGKASKPDLDAKAWGPALERLVERRYWRVGRALAALAPPAGAPRLRLEKIAAEGADGVDTARRHLVVRVRAGSPRKARVGGARTGPDKSPREHWGTPLETGDKVPTRNGATHWPARRGKPPIQEETRKG